MLKNCLFGTYRAPATTAPTCTVGLTFSFLPPAQVAGGRSRLISNLRNYPNQAQANPNSLLRWGCQATRLGRSYTRIDLLVIQISGKLVLLSLRCTAIRSERMQRKKQGSKQEVALGEWKNARGFATYLFAVHTHFVGFGIDFDIWRGAVVNHVFFPDAAAVAYRLDDFFQA